MKIIEQGQPIDMEKIEAPTFLWADDYVDSADLLRQAAKTDKYYRTMNQDAPTFIGGLKMPDNWLDFYANEKEKEKNSGSDIGWSSGRLSAYLYKYTGPYPTIGISTAVKLKYKLPFMHLLSPRTFILANVETILVDNCTPPPEKIQFFTNVSAHQTLFAKSLTTVSEETQETTLGTVQRTIYSFPEPIYQVSQKSGILNNNVSLSFIDIPDIREIILTFPRINDMNYIARPFSADMVNHFYLNQILSLIASRRIGMVQKWAIEQNDLSVLKQFSTEITYYFPDIFIVRWALQNGLTVDQFVHNDWDYSR